MVVVSEVSKASRGFRLLPRRGRVRPRSKAYSTFEASACSGPLLAVGQVATS